MQDQTTVFQREHFKSNHLPARRANLAVRTVEDARHDGIFMNVEANSDWTNYICIRENRIGSLIIDPEE